MLLPFDRFWSISRVVCGLDEIGVIVFLLRIVSELLSIIRNDLIGLVIVIMRGLSLKLHIFLRACMFPYHRTKSTACAYIAYTLLMIFMRVDDVVIVAVAFGRSLHGNKSK